MEKYEKINSISLNEAKNLLSKDLAYLTLKNGEIVAVKGVDNSKFDKKKRGYENWNQSQNIAIHNISNISNERKFPYEPKKIIKEKKNMNVRNSKQLNLKNKLNVKNNIKYQNNNQNNNYYNYTKNKSQMNKPIKTNKTFNKGNHFFSPNTYSFNNCSFYESNNEEHHLGTRLRHNNIVNNFENNITPYNLKNQNGQSLKNYTICKINLNDNNSFINGNKSSILGADSMNYEIIPLKRNNENLTINKSISYSDIQKKAFNRPTRIFDGFPNRLMNNNNGINSDRSGKNIFRIIKNRDNHTRTNTDSNVVNSIHSKYELKRKSPTSQFFTRSINNYNNSLNKYLIKSNRNNQGTSNNFTYIEIYNLNNEEN